MIMRQGPTAPPAAGNPIEELRALLDDDDETGAIAKMGQLAAPDAATVLGDGRMRSLAVDCFDNEEMARGVRGLRGGTLEQKLRWMFAEGTDWSLVRPLLADTSIPADQKTALYAHNDLRSEFTGICDNDEMADAVSLMGGTLEQRLNWMFEEGTSYRCVQRLISDPGVPAEQKSFLLTRDYMRSFFVDICTDMEMYVAVGHLGGTLEQRLRWMFAEGSNWRFVRQQIADPGVPADQKLALYGHNDLRSGFTDVCDDDEMAEAVRLLGGTLEQKLNWMFVEGTNWRAIRSVITDPAVTPAQRLALYPLDYMKVFFVENCDNDEMAEATILLGGAYRTERKPWLEAEGTSVNEYLNALTRLAVRETGAVAHRTPAQADQMIERRARGAHRRRRREGQPPDRGPGGGRRRRRMGRRGPQRLRRPVADDPRHDQRLGRRQGASLDPQGPRQPGDDGARGLPQVGGGHDPRRTQLGSQRGDHRVLHAQGRRRADAEPRPRPQQLPVAVDRGGPARDVRGRAPRRVRVLRREQRAR